jgi:uncharacterized RDD family membrane protein YckC
MEQTTPDMLHEFEEQVNLEPVTAGIRFVNYIIDVIAFYALIFGASLLYFTALYNQTGSLDEDEVGDGMSYLIALVVIVGYYTVLEGATKGRTLGKLATGTVVVKEDGSPITFKDAFLRSLSRLVPFEPFSALGGRPWHDSWTNTMVVKKTK